MTHGKDPIQPEFQQPQPGFFERASNWWKNFTDKLPVNTTVVYGMIFLLLVLIAALIGVLTMRTVSAPNPAKDLNITTPSNTKSSVQETKKSTSSSSTYQPPVQYYEEPSTQAPAETSAPTSEPSERPEGEIPPPQQPPQNGRLPGT